MLSLLIGVGTLLLALVISALIDPWPRPPRDVAVAGAGGQRPVTQLLSGRL
jgi:hypothetical protein